MLQVCERDYLYVFKTTFGELQRHVATIMNASNFEEMSINIHF